MHVNLTNPKTNQIKQTKVGFSWTVFFFGFWPAIFRGDWKWGLIMLLSQCLTFGGASLVFMFIYNKLYINELLSNGFMPSDNSDREILLSKGFTISNEPINSEIQ